MVAVPVHLSLAMPMMDSKTRKAQLNWPTTTWFGEHLLNAISQAAKELWKNDADEAGKIEKLYVWMKAGMNGCAYAVGKVKGEAHAELWEWVGRINPNSHFNSMMLVNLRTCFLSP